MAWFKEFVGRALLGSLLLAAVGSCSGQSAQALKLHAVEPSFLMAGDSLEVVGEGFLRGRPLEIQLQGQLFQPEAAPRTLQLAFPGEIVSGNLVRTRVPAALEVSVWPPGKVTAHATFRGLLVVSEPARGSRESTLRGSLPVVLELFPVARPVATEEQERALTERLEEVTGAQFRTPAEASAVSSVAVSSVAVSSRAAGAGLRAGDLLRSAGGVTVLGPGDLIPGPVRHLLLLVQRDGRQIEIALPVDGFWAAPIPIVSWIGSLLFGAVAGASLSRSWMRLLPARLVRVERAARSVAPGAVALTLLLVLLSAIGSFWVSALRPLVPSPIVLGGACAALRLCAGQSVARVREPGGAVRRGVVAASTQALALAPCVVGLWGIFFESGFDLRQVSAAQSPGPLGWRLFQDPFQYVLLVSVVAPSTVRHPVMDWSSVAWSREMRGTPWLSGQAFRQLELWLLACLVALAFLGGGNLPPSVQSPAAVALLGSFLLGLKTTSVYWGMRELGANSGGAAAHELVGRHVTLVVAALLAWGGTQVWRELVGNSPFVAWLSSIWPMMALTASGVALLRVAAARLRLRIPVSYASLGGPW